MNLITLKEKFNLFGNGLVNSYSQIFFSNSKVLGILLLIISFFDFGAGFSGVLSVLVCQITAHLFNFNKDMIYDGSYSYNSLMVGVALGVFYELNWSIFALISIVSILTFFITIWFYGNLSKKGLPFLSLPFLFSIWIVILGAKNFSALELLPKETLSLKLYYPEIFDFITLSIEKLPFHNVIYLYLRSLGAIFFQYNDLAGLIIAVGILCFSRISFLLSVFGFIIGYGFYMVFEGDFSQLIYSYIGFNFILTAMSLGGFFIVPSRKSFLLLLFAIPSIALLISGLHSLFTYFQLPLYSLPFNILVILFLYAMYSRSKASGIEIVTLQQYSPEMNHYKHFNSISRFKTNTYYHLALPVMGNWHISQGHNGGITHLGDWQYAWDFDVLNDDNETFRKPGFNTNDYYCYDLPVIAPAAGHVVEIVNTVEENIIGQVNMKENFGNTIIIKHGEGFYSKLSHLKKDSFKVAVGDYITKGSILARCGSSGRSPEPHLHFQLQATPFIGSKTLIYPIAYYLSNEENGVRFNAFSIPKEGEKVMNIQTTAILQEAFGLIPGKIMHYSFEGVEYKWEVFTNAYNYTYIYCYKTKSIAYFVNDGTLFYFTDFHGSRSSLLFHFYTGAHKVLLGHYKNIKLKDKLLPYGFFNPLLSAIHDFTAPFFHYCKVRYHFEFQSCDNDHRPSKIEFKTTCNALVFGKKVRQKQYQFTIENGQIKKIEIIENNQIKIAECND